METNVRSSAFFAILLLHLAQLSLVLAKQAATIVLPALI